MSRPLRPNATIGMLGGGQLGRMMAMAAASLGYRTHVFTPEPDSPAGQVSWRTTVAPYGDLASLRAFTGACDVVTYEFENIPLATANTVAESGKLFPGTRALEVAQDRLDEKRFVQRLGGRPAAFWEVGDRPTLRDALVAANGAAILKTRRLGYDGKGQIRLASAADVGKVPDTFPLEAAILEAVVQFDREFSIIVARGQDGSEVHYPAPDNRHEDGVLRSSIVPSTYLRPANVRQATELARTVADELDYVGVLTLEFFDTDSGPVFNEMAPRVHNSGHWTIDGATVSQFENHIRAVAGLPLRTPELPAGVVVHMQNILGGEIERAHELCGDDRMSLHLYGKSGAPGRRKMAHVTWLDPAEHDHLPPLLG